MNNELITLISTILTAAIAGGTTILVTNINKGAESKKEVIDSLEAKIKELEGQIDKLKGEVDILKDKNYDLRDEEIIASGYIEALKNHINAEKGPPPPPLIRTKI